MALFLTSVEKKWLCKITEGEHDGDNGPPYRIALKAECPWAVKIHRNLDYKEKVREAERLTGVKARR